MSLSFEHEAPIELCREHPELVPAILIKLLNLELPRFTAARVTDPGTRPVMPTGQRSDLSVILVDGEVPVAAAIFEPQRQVDADKWYSWPKYLADLHAEVRGPTYLIVLALRREVAHWAKAPIRSFQPGSDLAPYVIGPDEVPRLLSLEQALAEPLLSALSALVRADEPGAEEEALLAVQAMQERAGPDQAYWLYQLIRAIMTPERCQRLQDLIMLHPDVDKPKTTYEWAAFNRGKAASILEILMLRGIGLSEQERQRVLSEADPARLSRWLQRALTAASAADVLAD